jgi:hypothetical protein
MIYCVWYPSGGFGHFINAVLTLYGKDFLRPNGSLEFSSNGNSHNLDLVVPKYLHGKWIDHFDFLNDKNYCVLIDNGINDENTRFVSIFPGAKIIKICYSDYTWPIVARTMIEKAMVSALDAELPVDSWGTNEPWARREKYFLFLHDHDLRHAWKPTQDSTALYIDDLLDYCNCFNKLNLLTGVESFEKTWIKWHRSNSKYISPIEIAKNIITEVKLKRYQSLDYVTDIWTQAVVYYYIWITFGVEVPHNNFSNFFKDTSQIMDLVA